MNALAIVFHLAAATCAVLLIIKVSRTRAGAGGPVHDRHEAAFLNGGPARVVDAALAALQADGRIAIGGPGIVAVLRPTAHDPVERAVLQVHAAAPHGALHHLRMTVMRHPAVQEVGDALAARGLIVTPSARRSAVRRSAALGVACIVLVPVCLVLTVVDLARADAADLPLPFVFKVLPALAGAGITAVVCGSIASGRVTPAGRRAVAAYGRAYGHLADAGHLVALHGLRALPDPILREQLLAAARVYAPRRRGGGVQAPSTPAYTNDTAGLVTVWCAAGAGGGSGGGGCGGGGGCSAGSCSGGGSSCSGSGGSSCSSGSSGSGGSSCSSSSGSSCSSSSSSF
ncbi:TIGR04222 domain-containing membrane protein [Streptomyces lateritius]|uniref:TIGR04222 domain-containing membrane protein n=1 Tax=Streptomyces lateritius TaxID=67313 RepID=A0ABW6YBJ0_9ACTN